MGFSLKQKFYILAASAGLLLAIVSIIGSYNSYNTLKDSVQLRLIASVDGQGRALEGWLQTKAVAARGTANLITALEDNEAVTNMSEILALADKDEDILDIAIGKEDTFFQGRHAGDKTGEIDPRERGWYKQAKASGKDFYTEAYVDKFTGQLVTSAVAPFTSHGQFDGAICVDIALKELDEEASRLEYEGVGEGIIIEKSGNVLATSGTAEKMTDVRLVPGLGVHFDEMVKNGQGVILLESAGDLGESVFAYTTIPTTGWIMGISVPYEFAFASISSIRMLYGGLTLVGFILMVFMCLKLASHIIQPIAAVETAALEMAKGNLRGEDIPVQARDEIGSLSEAFNEMKHSLRKLIGKMAATSSQVASAAEELTANAQQSANASVHVAETVGDVSGNVNQQLRDIAEAKGNVDTVFRDIEQMAGKARNVADTSNQTAEAARRGAQLMENAVSRMGTIEASVLASADVVKKLGENSQQIGQIVEAISSIAEQTNLLSLNAAIEAARAGEQGRGFAVVAEEVRKLAAESQNSAEEIRERIGSIQEDTAQAVISMESGTRDVQEGTAAIREVGEQFKGILDMVDGITNQMNGIHTSVDTVSTGASRIVEAVDSIDGMSKKTSDDTQTISSATEEQSASNEEIAAASQSLAKLAEDMQAAVGQFKV